MAHKSRETQYSFSQEDDFSDILDIIPTLDSLAAETDMEDMHLDKDEQHLLIIFGASGDLARKKIYPTLWFLYRDNLLPQKSLIYGYARTKITVNELRDKCTPYMKVADGEQIAYNNFWKLNHFTSGNYDSPVEIANFAGEINTNAQSPAPSNRIFYLALPPHLFEIVTDSINKYCRPKRGWTRVIIEKPFGRDSESSDKLSKHLAIGFDEHELYRIDHYLGKEMVQNLMAIRFCNRLFNKTWDRDSIASVLISFKEPFGCQGRGGYFDDYGIIRDVMQNHLLQILSLVAMEKPISVHQDHIRNEKVKVLQFIEPLTIDDCVLGQYTRKPDAEPGSDESMGYLDDPGVPNESRTPTYALAVLNINNERWDGVPFILRCGKALNERKAEVRIQYRDVPGDIFKGTPVRNELVIRVQPGEAIYLKMMTKSPGIRFSLEETEMDLTYGQRYKQINLPDAYERLLLDVFCGSQTHFVRSDELEEAWRIFTPLLQRIDSDQTIRPVQYVYGSRGPIESDRKCNESNFKFSGSYQWHLSDKK